MRLRREWQSGNNFRFGALPTRTSKTILRSKSCDIATICWHADQQHVENLGRNDLKATRDWQRLREKNRGECRLHRTRNNRLLCLGTVRQSRSAKFSEISNLNGFWGGLYESGLSCLEDKSSQDANG